MKFPIEQQFKLSENFIEKYKEKHPPFGFNGLGEFVYMRTYSRIKSDGKNEMWWETVRRVVEGIYTIQKQHIEDYKLGWNQMKAQKSAQEMYSRIFNFKMLPAGRSLWAMGTPLIMEKGLASALYNCAFLSTENINIEPAKSFSYAMDMLMCGVGVGFDTLGKDKLIVREPKNKIEKYIIPDSREGWVSSLEILIMSFFGHENYEFDYSIIRAAGEPIKTFGGVSAGCEPLKDLHKKTKEILKNKIGKLLSERDIVDIFNLIAKTVVSGNVRRSAEIALGYPTEEFLNLKNYKINPDRMDFGWASNNSVYANIGSDYSFIAERIKDNAEPGIFWIENAKKYSRMKETEADFKDKKISGLNPCVIGSTLVAVADGRNSISIKQLSQEGNDVPVYCLDDNKKIAIRMMRNPRITGYNQPVYLVKFDSGASTIVTSNHKFLLTDGTRTEAINLKNGDSVKILRRKKEKLGSNSNNEYYCLYSGNDYKFEHRLIAAFYNNAPIPNGYLVHHDDENGLNNNPDNLMIITSSEHNRIHNDEKGEKNNNYSGYTHEQLKEHATTLTRMKGRRFSTEEWERYAKPLGLPIQFSQWRQESLGKIVEMSRIVAEELGFDNIDVDTKTTRKLKKYLDQGYNCYLSEYNKVIFIKNCEICGKFFETYDAESGICSPACLNKNISLNHRDAQYLGQKKTFENKKEILRDKQKNVYLDLKFSLNKEPSKKEWIDACKNAGLSFEISRKSSPFRNYSELINESNNFNHKVTSVEFCGYEDVYNGTVDDYHNYAIGGFSELTRKNNVPSEVFMFTANCGEINLESSELCNLVETFPYNHESLEDYKTTLKYAYLYGKSVTLLGTHWEDTNRVMLRNRRIGISITGVAQFIAKNGIKELENWMEEGYSIIQKYDKLYSDWLAIPMSIKTTCVKPSGTVSILAGATPGVHYPESSYYIRRIRIAKNSQFVNILKNSGYIIEPAIGQEDSTVVIEFPVFIGDNVRVIDDVSMWEQLNLAAFAQEHWSDNSVSVTITFDPEKEGKDIENALNYYQFKLKAVSFLPKLKEGAYPQMPYEEITKEEYEKRNKLLLPLDFSQLFSLESSGEKYCTNDVCMI